MHTRSPIAEGIYDYRNNNNSGRYTHLLLIKTNFFCSFGLASVRWFFLSYIFFCLVFVRRFQWRQANRIFVYIYKMHDFRHRYSFRVESLNWKHHTTPGVNYNYREFTYSTYQRTYLKIFYSNNLRRPYLHHNIACSSVKENNKIQLKIRFFFKVHSSE